MYNAVSGGCHGRETGKLFHCEAIKPVKLIATGGVVNLNCCQTGIGAVN